MALHKVVSACMGQMDNWIAYCSQRSGTYNHHICYMGTLMEGMQSVSLFFDNKSVDNSQYNKDARLMHMPSANWVTLFSSSAWKV